MEKKTSGKITNHCFEAFTRQAAKVFPLPVLAIPTTSRPPPAIGQQYASQANHFMSPNFQPREQGSTSIETLKQ